ncbi:PREDICTED: ensconsin-like [Priapulus caudatus]|uniref:Ensconsin-like n=1 Tax=Priapulus caudatus TaxID=37621 RepID=A0ABM1E120_PRICU|nr:PREDICTED: ensconsin-like [Priapulus caudatus]
MPVRPFAWEVGAIVSPLPATPPPSTAADIARSHVPAAPQPSTTADVARNPIPVAPKASTAARVAMSTQRLAEMRREWRKLMLRVEEEERHLAELLTIEKREQEEQRTKWEKVRRKEGELEKEKAALQKDVEELRKDKERWCAIRPVTAGEIVRQLKRQYRATGSRTSGAALDQDLMLSSSPGETSSDEEL